MRDAPRAVTVAADAPRPACWRPSRCCTGATAEAFLDGQGVEHGAERKGRAARWRIVERTHDVVLASLGPRWPAWPPGPSGAGRVSHDAGRRLQTTPTSPAVRARPATSATARDPGQRDGPITCGIRCASGPSSPAGWGDSRIWLRYALPRVWPDRCDHACTRRPRSMGLVAVSYSSMVASRPQRRRPAATCNGRSRANMPLRHVSTPGGPRHAAEGMLVDLSARTAQRARRSRTGNLAIGRLENRSRHTHRCAPGAECVFVRRSAGLGDDLVPPQRGGRDLARQWALTARRLHLFHTVRDLFHWWHVVTALAAVMILVMIVHVGAAVALGDAVAFLTRDVLTKGEDVAATQKVMSSGLVVLAAVFAVAPRPRGRSSHRAPEPVHAEPRACATAPGASCAGHPRGHREPPRLPPR